MHSRGPTEQHFYIWEPHRGCLHKVKKVGSYPLIKKDQLSHNIGKWSRTPNYYTTGEDHNFLVHGIRRVIIFCADVKVGS